MLGHILTELSIKKFY